tara:strand:- start:210 stop:896 length:687 start_codon:yes stop_codon:yes gene_type:complete
MLKFEAIVLCGGKGTRVSKFTKQIPKCLIDINGKPFLYYQLKFLKKNNINNVVISVGYLAKKVREYIKNNIDFINIKIKDDGKKLLGTGGAILKSTNLLKTNFFVIYGDSYLNFKLKKLVKKKNLVTMAIFKNNNKYDKSNIELNNSEKIFYYKNKDNKKLQFIDYGASYVNKQIFKGIKKNVKFDLSDLFEEISKKNMLSGYKVRKRFYEIGSYSGIKDLKNYLKKK